MKKILAALLIALLFPNNLIAKNPSKFTSLREKILSGSKQLPDMGEYMHKSYFDGADKFCKDTFLFIKYFGVRSLPRILLLKRKIDYFFPINMFNIVTGSGIIGSCQKNSCLLKTLPNTTNKVRQYKFV